MLCALAAALAAGPAMAGPAPVTRTQVRGGNTTLVILPTLPLGGQTLNGAGSLSQPGLQTLITLPANPTVKVGFRPDAVLPALPQSAIAPVHQPAAVGEAARFLEALGPELALDHAFKPGPGADLPPMQQQALLMAAKQTAVTEELKGLSASRNASDESSGALGRRLMDILTGEGPSRPASQDFQPDAPLSRYGFAAGVVSASRFALSKNSGVLGLQASEPGTTDSEGTPRPGDIPSLGESLIGADPASFTAETSAPRKLPLPIPLLTLKISRQVLSLSYAAVAGRQTIVTLSGTAAKQLSLALTGGSYRAAKLDVPFLVQPRTRSRTASLRTATVSPKALSELKTQAVAHAAVEGDSFFFLQQAGEALASQTSPVSGPSLAAWKGASPVKPSFPSSAPFLVVSFLPILGMALLTRGVKL